MNTTRESERELARQCKDGNGGRRRVKLPLQCGLTRAAILALAVVVLPSPSQGAQQCDDAGRVERIGVGTVGTMGTPMLVHAGLPLEDQGFWLELTGGLPGARGILAVGLGLAPVHVPRLGATLYPARPWLLELFLLDAAGRSPRLVELPLVLELCGIEGVAQAVVLDEGGKGGMAFTAAKRVRFGGAPSGPLFSTPSYVVGGSPRHMTFGDDNGDGILDILVVANDTVDFRPWSCGRAILSRRWGAGDGSFSDSPYGLCVDDLVEAYCSATSDLDGDGIVDVVVAGDSSISIGLGSGGGSMDFTEFEVVQDHPLAPLVSLAIDDLNGDGVPDLAALNALHEEVHVLFGNGDGTFRRDFTYPVGSDPFRLEIGDLDGNGQLDLVVTNSGSNDVSVCLGQGFWGRYRPEQRIAVGTRPGALLVEDLDGDGVLDLAVTNQESEDVSLLFGWGDGTFEPAQSLVATATPRGLAAGDLNQDGIPDLVVASLADEVAVVPGLGGGAFGAPLLHRGNTAFALSVGVADFDQDGRLDVAVLHGLDPDLPSRFGTDVAILFGRGDSTLHGWEFAELGNVISKPELGDFDGDGASDLAFVSGANKVSVALATENGSFDPPRTLAVGSSPVALAVEDFDRDGALDLIVANQGEDHLSLLLGNGDGNFVTEAALPVGSGPTLLEVCDLDRDGDPDLAVANEGSNDIAILVGAGDGSFQEMDRLGLPAPASCLAFAEINGDGVLDLVVGWEDPIYYGGTGSSRYFLRWYAGRGDRGFPGYSLVRAFGYGAHAIEVTDLGGDGLDDLLVLTNMSAGSDEQNYLAVYRNFDTDYRPYYPFVTPKLVGWRSLREASSFAVGDVDGEGAVDVVLETPAHAEITVLRPSYDSFAAFPYRPYPLNFAGGGGPVGLGDLDNDGDLDVFHPVSGGIAFLRNRLLSRNSSE